MATTGSAFIATLMGKTGQPREDLILAEFKAKSIPAFMKPGCAVSATSPDGSVKVTYYVMPDYLCIGTDADYMRVPMLPVTAQKVADVFDCSLPTRKMVDQIYDAAKVKLEPHGMNKFPNDRKKQDAYAASTQCYKDHNDEVEKALALESYTLGDLIAGHKKDILIAKALETHPKMVIIYGFHQKSNKGAALQPFSWVHGNFYVDYSHGVRLVKKTISVNGQDTPLADALKDKSVCDVLSHEGAFSDKSTRIPGA
jgi:hypothetical protein